MNLVKMDVVERLVYYSSAVNERDAETLKAAANIVRRVVGQNKRRLSTAAAFDLPRNASRQGDYNVLGQKRNGSDYNSYNQRFTRQMFISYKRMYPQSTVAEFNRWFDGHTSSRRGLLSYNK